MCVHTGGKEIRERLEEGEKKEIQEKYLGLIENACMHLEFDSGNANKNKNRYLRRNRIIQRKPTTVKYSNQYSYTSQSKQGPKKRYEFINSPNHFYPFSLTPPLPRPRGSKLWSTASGVSRRPVGSGRTHACQTGGAAPANLAPRTAAGGCAPRPNTHSMAWMRKKEGGDG